MYEDKVKCNKGVYADKGYVKTNKSTSKPGSGSPRQGVSGKLTGQAVKAFGKTK